MEFPHEGGVEWGPDKEGQTHGLYIYDPEHPLEDQNGFPVFAVRLNDSIPACGSKKQSKPGYCESPFRMLNGRCKIHGGHARRGLAHPNAKDLKRSKFYAKGRLHKRYEEMVNDPEVTHHNHSAALMDALTQEVLDSWDKEGGTPELWRLLKDVWQRYRVAFNAKDRSKIMKVQEEISLVLGRGVDQAEREVRIIRLQESARKARTAETNRKLAESLTFTLEEAEAFYTGLGSVVRRHMLNENMSREEVLRAIQDDMAAIAGRRGVNPTPPSGGPA